MQRASSDSTAASARRCGGPAAASVAIDAQFDKLRGLRDDAKSEKGHEVQKKTKMVFFESAGVRILLPRWQGAGTAFVLGSGE